MMPYKSFSSLSAFLWFVIKPYKYYYLMMLMASILGAFYDVGNQYAIRLVVDAFSATENTSYIPSFYDLLTPIIIFISAQISLDIIWRLGDFAEWRSEPYVRRTILETVYDYVQHHSYTYFLNTPGGSITSRIKGILDGYDNFWASLHHDFTPKLANSIVLAASLAIVNVKVCLMVVVWGITFVFLMYRISKKLDILSNHVANCRHHIFGLIADSITNIITVFAFATRKQEAKRLDKTIVQDFIPSNIRMYKYSFFSNVVGGLLYWTMLISLFLYMIHLRQTNQVSTGDLVFVMGISLRLAFDLWQLINKMQDFIKNLGDFKNAFEIMQVPHVNLEALSFPALRIVEPTIDFEKVHFGYDAERPVIQNLSLHIKAGEKVGLVGSTGAGKSTLVSLLLQYFYLDSGKMCIDGQDLSQVTPDSVRENISVIPQDILLFHRSILENMRYGKLDATEEEVIEAAKLANIHDFIQSLPNQYHTLVGERGIKVSGGQRQRIAIARAILKHAPILILDEATSSLDTETEQLIQTSLNTFLENKNITVLAIAHRLSTLKHMDRIVVLDKGRIIEEGTHNTLISQDSFYKKLWEMQQI